MADAWMPPMWFWTFFSFLRPISTRSRLICKKSSPAVPVKGTARRSTTPWYQVRAKAGTSTSRSSWRSSRLGG
jgi:hypothetical protein